MARIYVWTVKIWSNIINKFEEVTADVMWKTSVFCVAEGGERGLHANQRAPAHPALTLITWFYFSIFTLPSLVSNDFNADILGSVSLGGRLTLLSHLYGYQMMHLWLPDPFTHTINLFLSHSESTSLLWVLLLSVCLTSIYLGLVWNNYGSLCQYYLPLLWNRYKVKATVRKQAILIISPSLSR